MYRSRNSLPRTKGWYYTRVNRHRSVPRAARSGHRVRVTSGCFQYRLILIRQYILARLKSAEFTPELTAYLLRGNVLNLSFNVQHEFSALISVISCISTGNSLSGA